MKRRTMILVSAVCLAVFAMLILFFVGLSPITAAGLVLNTLRSAKNPPGTAVVEVRGDSSTLSAGTSDGVDASSGTSAQSSDGESWPSYNRTLTSERYSPLSQINAQTVSALKVRCSYDTQLRESFETGPLMVDGALIGTTAFDIFSIDPSNCKENWRTHEDYKPPSPLLVNRGAAYLDGRLFRATLDGRVLAYDLKTGMRVWATTIADPKVNEQVDAAPIAWNGLVFVGTTLGDYKGVKGRAYALAADNGNIVWETYLVPKEPNDPTRGRQGLMPASGITTWKNAPDVPISGGGTWTSTTLDPVTSRLYIPVGNPAPAYVKTVRGGENQYSNTVLVLDAKSGNYLHHFSVAPSDWHDWDVSNTPAIITTQRGKRLLSFSPKNGYLFGFDLATNQLLYRNPVNRIENADAPFSPDKPVHFCPGVDGGGEWNGVAFDPRTNLVITGETEWCTSVKVKSDAQVKAMANGEVWLGNAKISPLDFFGQMDPHTNWAGWLYATDADSGQWKWRLKTNYPITGGVTTTGGGIVFFGDMGGNFYAVNTNNGLRLWNQKLNGAVGGGVITYAVNGSQKVAVAVGMTSFGWPAEQTTGKIVILDLGK
jgi:alcohol dehydrogenase (cytochrome c)